MKDLHNNIKVSRALSPQASGDDTPLVTQILDRAGFESAELVIQTGAVGDANVTFTVLFEDGDASNLSDHAAVADEKLFGTEAGAAFQYDDDNECRKIGYRGNKRYLRATITPSGNSATDPAYISAVWVQGSARKAPLSTQAT